MISDIARAREALFYLNASCSRDEWVKVGMAAKASELTFDDFHSWSSTASNYSNEKDCNTVWKSINPIGGITASTLFAMANDIGWNCSKDRTNNVQSYNAITNPQIALPAPTEKATNTNALDIWENCVPATNAEGYIFRKQGNPEGLRIYPASAKPLVICGQNMAGYLVVPCWMDDKLQTLQFIPNATGEKLNLPNASFNDGFFTVGKITDRVFICEGIGQAWAIHKATGHAAIVCFGSGRFNRVAKVVRAQMPVIQMILVPDSGKELQVIETAKAVSCSYVELPENSPKNYDINDYLIEHGASALASLLTHAKVPNLRYKLLSGANLYNAAPMKWMVRGVLPSEGLAALYGASGSGKSFLALDMGCAIATGSEWFGRRVNQAPVTYVCLEGEAGLGKRIKAWSLYYEKTAPNQLKFITQPFDLLSNDVAELAKSVIAGGGASGLVMLDTLNRASEGADENSSVDMGKLIAASKRLQSLTGGMVLLVHHTGKDVTKGLRGHSSLYAALDGAIEVIKSHNRREWSVAKSKDDETGELHAFNLEVIKIGIDEVGDDVTSCVALPNYSLDKEIRRALPPKSGNQKIIWEALQDAFKKSPKTGQANAPEGRPCLRLDDAIDKTRDKLLCETKRQTERTRSAISGLVERGLLVHEEGWLWIA